MKAMFKNILKENGSPVSFTMYGDGWSAKNLCFYYDAMAGYKTQIDNSLPSLLVEYSLVVNLLMSIDTNENKTSSRTNRSSRIR